MAGLLIWLTGLAGAGKSTLGKSLYERIKAKQANTVLLDGDGFRSIFGNQGYTLEDRLAVAQRIIKLCHFLVNQDINVICATMSLFSEIQAANRQQVERYYEVWVYADFEELVRRDQKGLYSKALAGQEKNVVGVDLPYDIPQNYDLKLDNTQANALQEKVSDILKRVEDKFDLSLS